MITWGDVEAIAPELSSVANATQSAILAIVGRQVAAEQWGDLVDDGQKYLAAHIGTLSRRSGAGPVTGEQLGQMSRQYASTFLLKSLLGQTSYGLEYLRMIRLLPTSIGVVP